MSRAGAWIAYNERQTVVPMNLVTTLLKVNYYKVESMVKAGKLGQHIVVGSEEFDEAVMQATVSDLVNKGYEFVLSLYEKGEWKACLVLPPMAYRKTPFLSKLRGR